MATAVSTVREIEALQPRSDRYEVKVDPDPALRVVVFPTGKKSFVLRYRFDNIHRKLTLGPISLADARKRTREALVQIADGIDPATRQEAQRLAQLEVAAQERAAVMEAKAPPKDLVDTVIEEFIARRCSKIRSGREVARMLRMDVLPRWGGRRLSEIRRADVSDLTDEIIDRGAPIIANRVFSVIVRMIRWAVERGILEHNPIDRMKKPVKETTRARVLDDRELRLVWRACETIGWPFAPIVRLLILTAQRKSEISESVWAEHDLDAALLRLPPPRTKNGLAHDVPLSAPALKILKALPRVESETGLLFTVTGKTAVSGFSRAKENLDAKIRELNGGQDIPHWTFHDLRRSAASGMASLGVAPHVIEAVINHVSESKAGVAGIYNRYRYTSEIRAALDLWAQHVEGITRDNGGPV